MTHNDRQYMQQAVDCSRNCVSEEGKTSPMVGAVVVLNGEVMGDAYRGEADPGDHAEYILLEKKLADVDLAGATLFTTLEPCTKRNPPKIPCANRVIDRRIGCVIMGTLDPNPDIKGNGFFKLREAGIEVGLFDSDFMDKIEKMNRPFYRQFRTGVGKRSGPQLNDPVEAGTLGPNGHRIGYSEDGDKVEWIPDEETPGNEFPLLMRRNDNAITDKYNEFWEKVWWNRHQYIMEKKAEQLEQMSDAETKNHAKGEIAATAIEAKYSKDELLMDEYHWGELSGKLSALSWVLGSDWGSSLDT